MSKYDDLNYETYSEKTKGELPNCIARSANKNIEVPDELIGKNIQELKRILNVQPEDERSFEFANNGQTRVDKDYITKGKFFSENMSPNEKREYLLDYLKYYYGNNVDGKYFEQNLQDIFNLRGYELIAEDFEIMIKEYFKKNSFDLNDINDREDFKRIIYHEHIHLLNKNQNRNNYILNEPIYEDEEININD